MDRCTQYIELCEKDPQFWSSEDCEHKIAEGLLQLKKGLEQETVRSKPGLLGFLSRKKQAVYKPVGYMRGLAMVANQYSAMIPYAGLYAAYKSGDYSHLQQALYQFARITALFGNVMDSGEDHSTGFRSVIWGLAAGDRPLLEILLPEECGVATTGHPLNVVCTNLLMGLWYGSDAHLAAGKESAAAWLKSKHTVTHAGTVRYLLALTESDAVDAGEALLEICKGIPHEKDFFVQSAAKQFGRHMVPFLHGLYSIAYFIKGREFCAQLPMPEQYMWEPYTEYLAQKDYPSPAGWFIDFSGEAQMINWMLERILPVKLTSPDRKAQFIDSRAFVTDLLDGLAADIDVEAFFRQYS